MEYDHALHWRFSRYVDFQEFLECWRWTGASVRAKRSPKYRWGVLNVRGKCMKASRVSWILNRGPIPDGANVLHTCDDPLCVNPGHLYLGTQAENVEDMDRKQRRVSVPHPGEKHWNAKLTKEQVDMIRTHKGSATPLARELGVTPEQINNIRRRAQWREES